MAKYFYVYNIVGVEDSIVKMFNTETGAVGEKSIQKDRIDGFVSAFGFCNTGGDYFSSCNDRG